MSITKGRRTTMKHSRTLRLPALAVTIALVGLVVAACGSSSNTGSSTTTGSGSAAAAAGGANSAARSKLAACLKSHGVTLPSRPAGAGKRPPGGSGGGRGYGGAAGGFFFGGGGGKGSGGPGAGRFSNPKFRAAIQACGGGRFPQRRATLNKAAITKFTACIKQHGYNLPTPNFSGKGPVFPAAIQHNKKFQAAAKACASDLRPQGAPAPGSAPPAGGGSSD